MFGMQVLDIAVGMIFIYLMLSFVCTAGTELVASILRLRAKTFAEGISKLLHDDKIEREFFEHPLIKGIGVKRPTFCSAETFTLTVANILSGHGLPRTVPEVRNLIDEKLGDKSPELRKVLLILVDEAGDDVQKLQKSFNAWFDNAMEAVSAWYRAKAKIVTFFVALAIAVLANADTIQITRSLANDPALRQALVAQATEMAKQDSVQVPHGETKASKRIEETLGDLKDLGIPLGWKTAPTTQGDWLSKITGLTLTMLAMTLGAPFWYDLLKKVVSIRSARIAAASIAQPSTPASKESANSQVQRNEP